jgi:hemolysin activation/secretion protein
MTGYSSPVNLTISVNNSSTAETGDYTLNTSSINFNSNGTQTISIDINNDIDNDDETIVLDISISSGTANLVNNQHLISVSDDELQIIITEIADPNNNENAR